MIIEVPHDIIHNGIELLVGMKIPCTIISISVKCDNLLDQFNTIRLQMLNDKPMNLYPKHNRLSKHGDPAEIWLVVENVTSIMVSKTKPGKAMYEIKTAKC